MKNIFVLALNEGNLRTLHAVPKAEDYRFHQLLAVDDIQFGQVDIGRLFDAAVSQLDEFPGPIDAIVSSWVSRPPYCTCCCASITAFPGRPWSRW